MDEARQLIEAIRTGAATSRQPFIVALDGRSGSGKSTLAADVAPAVDAVVIEGDDFYSGGSAEFWDSPSPKEKVDHAIDWQRQRELLIELRRGDGARWFPFDWNTFEDASLSTEAMSCEPSPVVILEGAYSARPELADHLDLRVLLDTPEALCGVRLRKREGDEYSEDWEARWRSAEEYYFGTVMPRSSFDLVVSAG